MQAGLWQPARKLRSLLAWLTTAAIETRPCWKQAAVRFWLEPCPSDMAFTAYSSTRLETQQLPGATSSFSPLLALTRGIGAVLPATAAAAAAAPATAITGRLPLCPVHPFTKVVLACRIDAAQPCNPTASFVRPCAGVAAASATAQLTLPDGRLHIGTHLPLLAQRYRYLSLLGEGVSAQVGAAATWGWTGEQP